MSNRQLIVEISSISENDLRSKSFGSAMEQIGHKISSAVRSGKRAGSEKVTISSGDIDIPYEYYVKWSL